jgi:hypothetical protein
MKLIQINKNLPVFLYKDFKILDKDNKNYLIEHILNHKKMDMSNGQTNMLIENDKRNILNNLYDLFIETLEKDFNVEIDWRRTKKTCWSYCTNAFNPSYIWHNHSHSSTMHSVYYLNIPNALGGELDFELNGNFFKFKPSPNDLLIMPDFLNHAPSNSLSNEYRISINMEAYCTKPSNVILNNLLIRR